MNVRQDRMFQQPLTRSEAQIFAKLQRPPRHTGRVQGSRYMEALLSGARGIQEREKPLREVRTDPICIVTLIFESLYPQVCQAQPQSTFSAMSRTGDDPHFTDKKTEAH